MQGCGCPSGEGCLIDIDGSAGGTNNNYVANITFDNFYLETTSGSSGNMNYIEVNNARAVELNNVQFNGGPGIAKCLTITESGTNVSGYVHLSGRVTAARCTGVSNTITGGGVATSAGVNQDIVYTYPGNATSGVAIDGALRAAPNALSSPPTTLPACNAGMIMSFPNSTTNTWGATISLTSSGGVPVLGYCDGTNWTVIGK
jgi:hypothetical protein